MKSIYFLPLILLFFACSDSDDGQNNNENETPTDVIIPLSIYQKIYKTTSDIYIDGGYVYISTNGVPGYHSGRKPAIDFFIHINIFKRF